MAISLPCLTGRLEFGPAQAELVALRKDHSFRCKQVRCAWLLPQAFDILGATRLRSILSIDFTRPAKGRSGHRADRG